MTPSFLQSLPILSDARTRSVSPENPTGEPGGGARAEPGPDSPASALGKGWKVRPYVKLPAGEPITLADVAGPGVVQHIWLTVHPRAYRDAVLRVYWDGEEAPSIEAPLGDFFANGHAWRYTVSSLMVAVNPSGGFNCYWPMPFRSRARFTLTNEGGQDIDGCYYQITYAQDPVPDDAAYLHAQFRRSVTRREHPEHVLLDGVSGRGHYVGTFVAWTQLADGWWGEGEVKFFIDDDTEHPTVCGTGTEDYFGGAWGFGETFSAPFVGYPLWRREPGEVPKHALYRWHVLDPIRFERRLAVTVQALGWWPTGKFQPLEDDIASTVFWYQAEPHAPFPQLPPLEQRWPRGRATWPR